MFGNRQARWPAAGCGACGALAAGLVLCWPLLGAAQLAAPTTETPQVTAPTPPALGTDGFPPAALQAEEKRLADMGITVGLQEQSEVWANLAGGKQQGLAYDGLTTAKLDIDLSHFGWSGAEFFFDGFDIHGRGASPGLVGSLQLVSSIEAAPGVKLFDLWLDQSLFDKRVSLRFGQEGADDEMMTTAYGGLFIDSCFGFPSLTAVDLPSGGPAYPLASPFVRLQGNVSSKLTLAAGVYTEDPAPPGTGDPQARDQYGTAFRLDDHALGFAEMRLTPYPDAPSGGPPPTTYKLGLWYASGNFADPRFDTAGGLLADPANAAALPRQHPGDYGIYAVVDQQLWQAPGAAGQSLGGFLRVMGAPGDRNLADLMVQAGVNWAAPLASRPNDIAGLAFGWLGLSSAEQDYGRDLVAFGRAASPFAGSETIIETTYQAPLNGWLTLQPDLQLVLNPDAGMPVAGTVRPAGSPDVVLGLRVTIKL
jgi:porin